MSTYIKTAELLGAGSAIQGTAVPVSTKRKYTKVTAANFTGAPVVLAVWLVPSGGTATNTHKVLSRTLADLETYNCPEVISGASDALGSLHASGLNISFSFVTTDTINS